MAGLRIAQERQQYEPGVAPGFVREQDPPAGTRVLREAGIVITISRGPEPPGGALVLPGGAATAPPAPPSAAPIPPSRREAPPRN